HRLVTRAHAGELQRKITFDRPPQMAFAALVKRPAPLRTLNVQQMLLQPRFDLEIDRVHEMVEDDELRVHLRIRLQRRVPVALGLLQRDKRTLRAIYRVINLRDELVMRRHGNRRAANFNSLTHISPLPELSPRPAGTRPNLIADRSWNH